MAHPGLTSAAASPAGHEHRWRGVEFYLEDDHPFFRMVCPRGEVRSIRAWERYWDPALALAERGPDDATPAPAERPTSGRRASSGQGPASEGLTKRTSTLRGPGR